MSTTKLSVQISNPSNGLVSWVDVSIRDKVSGELLAGFRADPAAWYAVLHGGVLDIEEGRVSPNLHRVGKRMETTQFGLPVRNSEPEDVAKAYACDVLPPGWSDYEAMEVRKHNTGKYGVVLRRWVADS